MTDQIKLEEIENKEKIRTFSETYKGFIFSVGPGPQEVFSGVTYSTMVAQVWDPGTNTMSTVPVCDNKRTAWARDPQPLPLSSLAPDLPSTILSEFRKVRAEEEAARVLDAQLRERATPAEGKFVRVHGGPHSGSYGKVFWCNPTRVGITTTMEKEKGDKFKAPVYKDVLWCQSSDVTVLLQTTPKKGTKELALLLQYANIVLGYLCGTPVVDFEALWSKVKSRPVCLALMYAYWTRSSDLRRYGDLWSLVRMVEGDKFLSNQLTLAVEKSDPAHFVAPWFTESLRTMVEATFPPEVVTTA